MGGMSDPQRLVPLGLDYLQVECIMRFLGIEDQLDAFQRIQVMEAVILEVFSQHARAQASRSFHHR